MDKKNSRLYGRHLCLIWLLELLKVAGVTQQSVASTIGVTKALISQWKRMIRPIPEHHFDAIYALTGQVMAQDFARDEEIRKQLKTRQDWEKFHQHQADRDYAWMGFRDAVVQWMELIQPGTGFERLQQEITSLTAMIAEHQARGIEALTEEEEVNVTVAIGKLGEVWMLNRLAKKGRLKRADGRDA